MITRAHHCVFLNLFNYNLSLKINICSNCITNFLFLYSGHGIHVQNSTLFNDFQSPKISQSSGDKSSREDKEFQGTPSTLNGGKKMTTDGLQQFEQAFKNFDTTELTLVPEGDQDSGTGDDDPVITPGEIPSIYMNATIKER